MKHDWKKATLIPVVAAKDRDASNLPRHFLLGVTFFARRYDTQVERFRKYFLCELTKGMLLLVQWKAFKFSSWLTPEMLIWLENSTHDIRRSEDFDYLHWRLVADYPGHVTIYFRIQSQRPVYPKDPICDI